MKRIFLLLSLLVFSLTLWSQEADDYFNPEKAESKNSYVKPLGRLLNSDNTHIRMSVGAGVGLSSGSTGAFSKLSLGLEHDLSDRFSLHFGTSVIQSTGFAGMIYSDNAFIPLNKNMTRNFVYGGGSYQVNEKLKVSGTAYYETNIFNQQEAIPGSKMDNKGVILGAEYKVGNESTIGIEVEVSNGNPYGYRSPMMFPGQTPFR